MPSEAETEYKTKLYEGYLEQRKLLIEGANESRDALDKALLQLSSGALGFSMMFIRFVAPTPHEWSVPFLVGCWIFFGISLLAILLSFLFAQCAFDQDLNHLQKETDERRQKEEEESEQLITAEEREQFWQKLIPTEESRRKLLPLLVHGHRPMPSKNSFLDKELARISAKPAADSNAKNDWTSWVDITNWISLGSFVIGVGILTFFLSVNIPSSKTSEFAGESKSFSTEGPQMTEEDTTKTKPAEKPIVLSPDIESQKGRKPPPPIVPPTKPVSAPPVEKKQE